MTSAEIKISCGIGDAITYITRLPEFIKREQVNELSIWIAGGWQQISRLIKEVYEPCKLINKITYHSEKADKHFDWIADDAPLIYPMTMPFDIPIYDTDKISLPSDWKVCVIHPITTEGSFEGYNCQRYLEPSKWVKICDKIHDLGYKIVQIGGAAEGGYLPQETIDLNLSGITTIRESIGILKNCDFCIGCNSWPWEVSSYKGIKTVCLYYTNTHWIRLHVPKPDSKDYGLPNLRIETDKNIDKIIGFIEELQ